MSFKALSFTVLVLGFSIAGQAAEINCYSTTSKTQTVGKLSQDGNRSILTLTAPLSSQDTSTKFPVGTYDVTPDRMHNEKHDVAGFGCFDGTVVEANFDEAEGDQLYLNLEVQCDMHPHFNVYNFDLICD